jgi:putative CRISPR-associated protein (TIGR02620 family)
MTKFTQQEEEDKNIDLLWRKAEAVYRSLGNTPEWDAAHEVAMTALRARSARWAAESEAEAEAEREWEFSQRDLGWGVDPAPKVVDLIVTRHHSLVLYLIEKGLATSLTEVISHVVDEDILIDKRVAGVLPLHLAALCGSVVSVTLNLPASKRGVELTLEEMREYSTGVETFYVRTASHEAAHNQFILNTGSHNESDNE